MKFPRFYETLLAKNLGRYRQMAFLAGPRQVGKTTVAKARHGRYFNWDSAQDRALFMGQAGELEDALGLQRGRTLKPRLEVVFDELHKYRNWKRFLKGFFDLYEDSLSIVVTGSSRLDVYRRGGDSMMGRYFLYHMHPLSVAELLRQDLPSKPVHSPQALKESSFQALWRHGGFPEPLSRNEDSFSRRWRLERRSLLMREDIRETTMIQNLAELEHLVLLLEGRSALQLSYRALSGDLGIAEPSIKKWILALTQLHHGFMLAPWQQANARSLRKGPKWYLRDWGGIEDPGQRAETFVACHLLKAAEGWRDCGLGDFSLHYIRDKEKREVDFLVVRDGKPWLLAEVKTKERQLSPSLLYYASRLKAPHALQLVMEEPYQDIDCFKLKSPAWVPAKTFLSQLL